MANETNAWGASRKHGRSEERKYATLQGLPEALNESYSGPNNNTINLCCVVLGFSQPFRTRSGDWKMSMSLVDKSLTLVDDQCIKLCTINVFVKPNLMHTLPQVRSAGDVVQLNDIKLQNWHNQVQLVGDKRCSSFAVLRGGNNMDDDPTATTTEPTVSLSRDESTVSDEEKKRMLDLWKWSRQERLLLHATTNMDHTFKLSDMLPPDDSHSGPTYHDVTVMVAAIIPVPKEKNAVPAPCGFLRVWDGSGNPVSDKLPLETQTAKEAIQSGDPPTVAIIKLAGILKKVRALRNNPDLQPPKMVTGRVANVAVWEEQHWELFKNTDAVSVGSFIRLRNVQDSFIATVHTERLLNMSDQSSCTPLPDMTYEVLHLLEEHNARLLQNHPVNLDSGILPHEADQGVGTVGGQQRRTAGNVLPHPPRQQVPPPEHVTPTKDGTSQCLNSLQDFMCAECGAWFDGPVRVVGLNPKLSDHSKNLWPKRGEERRYEFVVVVEDASSSLLVEFFSPRTLSNGAGGLLFGMPASEAFLNPTKANSNFRHLIGEKCLWNLKGRSVLYKRKRYNILEAFSNTA